MPTLFNRDHRRLFTTMIDLIKKSHQDLERDPGIHIGHISVYHNGHMIVLSGFKGYKENMAPFYRPSEEIWVYDQIVEKWIKKLCTGESSTDDIPHDRSGATGTVINNFLYMFGGYSEEGNLNTLHRLDLNTLKWRLLKPSGMHPLACDKSVSWEYGDKLYLFAGYGRGPDPTEWHANINYQFMLDCSSHWHYRRGWNNQLVCYDPETNSWDWPQFTGTVPISRAAHAQAKIGNKVYIFGGRNGRIRMNDLYELNMDSLEWKQIFDNNEENNPVQGRSWHTLTPISDHSLVLYGGFSQSNNPLNDCWILDTLSYTWTQVALSSSKPRLWHSAILSSFGEIFIYGGAIKNIILTMCHSKNNIFARDMFSIQFQPKSLLRLSLGAVPCNETFLKHFANELPYDLQTILYQRYMASVNKQIP